ncbi:hypothetical protein EPN42_02035 [bacterium]|nr:MAG: hypothetical protein EPN42_02035 [bacterium]
MVQASEEIVSDAGAAFALLCEVEKWPVWLSLVRSVRRLDGDHALCLGSEVAIQAPLLGSGEEIFVVERFLQGHLLRIESAFSCRRSWEFRIERKGERARLAVALAYPTYGGWLGAQLDRLARRRKAESELWASVVHFKGLVEFENHPDRVLADF